MHNYADAYKAVFPAGARGSVVNTYAHFIMPFVEMQAAYSVWQPDVQYSCYPNKYGVHNSMAFVDPSYTATAGTDTGSPTRLSMYTCPSEANQTSVRAFRGYNYKVCIGNTGVYAMTPSSAAKFVQNGRGWVTELVDGTVTVRHNKACFGMVRGEGRVNATKADLDLPDSAPTPPNKWYSFPSNGNVAFAEVTDGLSNTLCMSEAKNGYFDGRDELIGANVYDLRGWIAYSPSALFSAFLAPNSSTGDISEQPTYCYHNDPTFPCQVGVKSIVDVNAGSGEPAVNYYVRAARSYHTGGVNCSLADGSVQFVSDTVNMATWRAMASAAGGESVSF